MENENLIKNQTEEQGNDLLPLPDHKQQTPPEDLQITEDTQQTPPEDLQVTDDTVTPSVHLVSRQETRSLHVQFDDEDLEKMRDSLARQTMEISALQEEKKEISASINRQIKTLHDRNETLAQDIISQGKDMPVAVEVTFNKPEMGKKTIVRMDTMDAWVEDMVPADQRLDNLPHEMAANVLDGSNDEDAVDSDEIMTDPPPFGPDAPINEPEDELEQFLSAVQSYRSEKHGEDPEKMFVGLDRAYFSDALTRGVSPEVAFEGYVIYLKEWEKDTPEGQDQE